MSCRRERGAYRQRAAWYTIPISEAESGAVTLIQHFSPAANLNIHLHCVVLDGVYRRSEVGPVAQGAPGAWIAKWSFPIMARDVT